MSLTSLLHVNQLSPKEILLIILKIRGNLHNIKRNVLASLQN